jgi:hypothetical protein
MQELFAKRWFRWAIGLIAFVAMFFMASYQRRTGPTWPVPVDDTLAGSRISGELIRTQAGDDDARVAVSVADDETLGEVVWRRYPTREEWSRLEMVRETAEEGTELAAYLPNQPMAAKLEYSVRLWKGNEELTLPHAETAVIRFRRDVPAWVLIPHIAVMFLTLWLVFRAALGAIFGEIGVRRFIPTILGLLLFGGFFLGPLVQKYAFDAWWTGWPFGGDWTDNKTLAALIAWVVAWWICKKWPPYQRAAVLFATVVMVVVYLIPHSIHGSELDWEAIDAQSDQMPND